MLHISKISNEDAYNEGWKKGRLGKFTASMMSKLISVNSDKGVFSAGAMTYIEGIAGEILTRQPFKAEFFNANVDHGNAMEPEAIAYFEKMQNKKVLRDLERADTHRLIIDGPYTACTPDALIAQATIDNIFDESGERLKVAPLETKCPPVHHRYIKLYKCLTPQDLLAVAPDYYWQVMTQMVFCESLSAYFAAYNPLFPEPMRVILFKKVDLLSDVGKLKNTLFYAMQELEKCLSLFNKN